jgi:hypothetical protein
MKRRTVLAALGTGLTGLSGCTALGDESDETVTPMRIPDPETPTPEPWGPPAGDGPRCYETGDGYRPNSLAVRALPGLGGDITRLPCPSFPWADRTVCHHTADLESEGVALVSLVDRLWLPTDRTANGTGPPPEGGVPAPEQLARFAVANRLDGAVRFRPADWALFGVREDGLRRVASGDPGCLRSLDYEGVHFWALGVNRRVEETEINLTGIRRSLAPGAYLFALPVATPEEALALVAPFEVLEHGAIEETRTVAERDADPPTGGPGATPPRETTATSHNVTFADQNP